MNNWRNSASMWVATALLFVPCAGQTQGIPPPSPAAKAYSPYLKQDFPNQVFYGDTQESPP